MNQKVQSALLPIAGLLQMVVVFSIDSGGETWFDVPWKSLSFSSALLAWGVTLLSKSPQDAHKVDKNGGR